MFADDRNFMKTISSLNAIKDELIPALRKVYNTVKTEFMIIGTAKVTGKFLKRESLILIYRTLIEPYLRYCSIVWGQCNETQKDKLQALQNKADRTIAKLNLMMQTIRGSPRPGVGLTLGTCSNSTWDFYVQVPK